MQCPQNNQQEKEISNKKEDPISEEEVEGIEIEEAKTG
jgi:hypothetical protein